MSARRSGFEPWTADRFGDLDLQTCAETFQLDHYPAGLDRALSSAPPGPWIYTGALENRPELIDRLSRIRPLYGMRGESLRAVRDPFRLATALAEAGLPAPRCARRSDDLPRDGSWLRKPLSSAGGFGVRAWAADSADDLPTEKASFVDPPASSLQPPAYFQHRIDGPPVAALYVAADRRAKLLGVTRQLIGLDWCGLPARSGHRFRYCGSIGPLPMALSLTSQFEQLGNALAEAFDLRGLFGVDAIISEGQIWPVEVNPRYTASVEILEHALGVHSLALHVAAFGGDAPPLPPSVQAESDRPACCGKAILFATCDTIVSPEFPDRCLDRNKSGGWPSVADIPAGGTSVLAGHPIVTVLADGPDEAAVMVKLMSLASLAFERILMSFNGRNR